MPEGNATSVWVTAAPMRIHSSFTPDPRQSIVPGDIDEPVGGMFPLPQLEEQVC